MVAGTALEHGRESVAVQSLILAYAQAYDETAAAAAVDVAVGVPVRTSLPRLMRLQVGSRMAEMVAAVVSSLGTVADSALHRW